jgi:tetratricopeptide (TPR) repeat protein
MRTSVGNKSERAAISLLATLAAIATMVSNEALGQAKQPDLDRAMTLLAEGDFQKAAASFEQHLKAEPRSVRALVYRAGALARLREYDTALGSLATALEIEPSHMHALAQKAAILKEMGKTEEAARIANDVAKLSPKTEDDCLGVAGALLLLRRPEEAVKHYTRALELHADSFTYQTRGVAYNSMGRYQQSISDHTEAITRNPRCALAYLG